MTDSADRSTTVQAVTWAMWALALFAMVLRLYSRLGITRTFGADDWFMVAAMIVFTINSVVVSGAATHGVGHHQATLQPQEVIEAMHYWYFCYLTYMLTMMLSKTSVAWFLLRLCPKTTNQTHRIIIYIALSLTVLCGIAFFLFAVFQCWPVYYFWYRIPGIGTCSSIDSIITFTYVYSAFSIITDFTFTILPFTLIWTVKIDTKTKIALMPVFCMAAIASSAVAVRLAYVQEFRGNDFLWSISNIATWSQVEEGLAVAAGCFATLRPILRKILERVGSGRAREVPNSPGVVEHRWSVKAFGRHTLGKFSISSTSSPRTNSSV